MNDHFRGRKPKALAANSRSQWHHFKQGDATMPIDTNSNLQPQASEHQPRVARLCRATLGFILQPFWGRRRRSATPEFDEMELRNGVANVNPGELKHAKEILKNFKNLGNILGPLPSLILGLNLGLAKQGYRRLGRRKNALVQFFTELRWRWERLHCDGALGKVHFFTGMKAENGCTFARCAFYYTNEG